MRGLTRNKLPFFYAHFLRTEENVIDGKRTGTFRPIYTNPTLRWANISPPQGEYITRVFGEDLNYHKVISYTDNGLLDDIVLYENSVLWVDTVPMIAKDGTTETPHDYIVYKVAKSLNSVLVAITKVQVKNEAHV